MKTLSLLLVLAAAPAFAVNVTLSGTATTTGATSAGFLTVQSNTCHSQVASLNIAGAKFSRLTVPITGGAFSISVPKAAGWCYQVGVYDSSTHAARFLTGFGAVAPTADTNLDSAATTATSPDATVAAADSAVGGSTVTAPPTGGSGGSSGGTGGSSSGTGFTIRGAFTAGTAYAANDLVLYGGSTYLVPTGFTAGSTFNASNYTLFVSKGDKGDKGDPGTSGSAPAAGVATQIQMNDGTGALTAAGGSANPITVPTETVGATSRTSLSIPLPQKGRCGNAVTPFNGQNSFCLQALGYWAMSADQLYRSNNNPSQGLQSLDVQAIGLQGGANTSNNLALYGKTTSGAASISGRFNNQGQHVLIGGELNSYGIGDGVGMALRVNTMGGNRDNADQGAQVLNLAVSEFTIVPSGLCSANCTTGSTNISLGSGADLDKLGEGQFLADMTLAVTGAGVYVSNAPDGGTGFREIGFSGSSLPVSKFVQVTADMASDSTAKTLAPGTITVPIATSGVPTGFLTSTSTLTAGVACAADMFQSSSNFEQVNFTVVDATHLSVTANKVHKAPWSLAIGGTCGMGFNPTADDAVTGNATIRHVIPSYGSRSATTMYVDQLEHVGQGFTGDAFLSVSCSVVSAARASNVATVVLTGCPYGYLDKLPVALAGSLSDLNGTTPALTMTADSGTQGTFTFASTGANESGTGGSAVFNNGTYKLIPIMEILKSGYNATTLQTDGSSVTLAPHTVALATGHSLQMAHYYLQGNGGVGESFSNQYTPQLDQEVNRLGCGEGGAVMAAGLVCLNADSSIPLNTFLEYGGTHQRPWTFLRSAVPYRQFADVQYGKHYTMFKVHPLNGDYAHGLVPWDLVALDEGGGGGTHLVTFDPIANTAEFNGIRPRYNGVEFCMQNGTNCPAGNGGGSVTVDSMNAAYAADTVHSAQIMGRTGSGGNASLTTPGTGQQALSFMDSVWKKQTPTTASPLLAVEDLIAGTNVTLTPTGNKLTINATASGGGGSTIIKFQTMQVSTDGSHTANQYAAGSTYLIGLEDYAVNTGSTYDPQQQGFFMKNACSISSVTWTFSDRGIAVGAGSVTMTPYDMTAGAVVPGAATSASWNNPSGYPTVSGHTTLTGVSFPAGHMMGFEIVTPAWTSPPATSYFDAQVNCD